LLDNGQQSMAVRGIGLIQSVDDIQNIVVSTTNDVPVYVRDIGRVQIGSAREPAFLPSARGDRSRRRYRADAARREPQVARRRA
jgi:multidrug efflux pump subunit AcrB